MQPFNVCTLCMQSIRWLQQKLWHKLISPCMYCLSTNKTLIKKQCKKWLSSKCCHFVKQYFYGIKLLHANVQCFCLCWGLTSQSKFFQSCRDGATASWVINQYFRGVKCLAQGHNTVAVGFEPPTSRSKCPMCLHCVYKVSGCFSKSCRTSWIPRIRTTYMYAPLRITKGNN